MPEIEGSYSESDWTAETIKTLCPLAKAIQEKLSKDVVEDTLFASVVEKVFADKRFDERQDLKVRMRIVLRELTETDPVLITNITPNEFLRFARAFLENL